MTLLDILPTLGRAARLRLDPAIWPLNTRTDDLGRLCVGGIALTEVADQFGTPTCVLDEDDFRHRARRCRKSAEVVYSAKALLTIEVARWARDEGLGVAVGSAAELATALAGDVDPGRIVWQSNTRADLHQAVAAGAGRIVVDSAVEIAYLAGLARRPQEVLIRLTPEVDPAEPIRHILAAPLLELVGVHCRGGEVRHAIAVMADVRARHHVILPEVTVCCGDRDDIDDALDAACAAERFPRPRLIVEEGARISAQAGVTLYRVGTVAPRGPALVTLDGDIGADSIATLANRHSLGPSRTTTVHGDEAACDMELPADLHPGDLLAVARTGGYQPGMAAPLLAVKHRRIRALIDRETVAGRLARDRG